MNAVPSAALDEQLIRDAQALSEEAVRPIPGSRKIFVEGSRADLRVPMREIAQTAT